MPLRYSLLFVFWCAISVAYPQQPLSDAAQISVVSCGPGKDLYSSFGHSAFRVQDPSQGIDAIYNYGTFDFDAPHFYLNFARGKLQYALSKQRFENFLYTYQLENRWVREQLLDLHQGEKDALFRFLEWNYQPENRKYNYDFFFDNCATKIPEVLEKVLGDEMVYGKDHLEKRASFRQLIQQNLSTNSWASFGIDLALGSRIDRKASVHEHMFLPFYVLRQFNNTLLGERPLVLRERQILANGSLLTGGYFTMSPLFWLFALMAFTAIITFIDKNNRARNRYLDFSLFAGSGLVGVLIIFLWFFTDHTATAYNFNLFWGFPLNLPVAFYLLRKNKAYSWLPFYLVILIGLLLISMLLWAMEVQVFSPLLLFIWIAMAIRYAYLYKYFNGPALQIK